MPQIVPTTAPNSTSNKTPVPTALSAAAEGRGAALASSLLVAEDLRAGRLAALRTPTVPVRSRYTAACLAEAARTPRVSAFFAWMQDELSRDRAEFPDCFPDSRE